MTNDAPLVSVVIAAHNYGHFLPAAVQSVIEQTYGNWECIIVNDASTDDTASVAASFAAADPRIRVVNTPRNLGEAGTRNFGNRLAGGRYVAVLDADDWWEPQKLQLQLELLGQKPDAVLCFTGTTIHSPDNTTRSTRPAACCVDLPMTLRCENFIFHSSVVVSRSALAEVGGYRPEMPPAADWELWLRVLSRFGPRALVCVDRPVTHYRVHGSNMTTDRSKLTRAERRVVRKYLANRGWALRRPAAALQVLEEQLYREQIRSRHAGAKARAVMYALLRLGMGPWRRWRWVAAVREFAPTA